ncbi:hypothetical protein J3F84DRAFT_17106 [Trichoderma pleuroticola]
MINLKVSQKFTKMSPATIPPSPSSVIHDAVQEALANILLLVPGREDDGQVIRPVHHGLEVLKGLHVFPVYQRNIAVVANNKAMVMLMSVVHADHLPMITTAASAH